jgi:hypothetical protein
MQIVSIPSHNDSASSKRNLLETGRGGNDENDGCPGDEFVEKIQRVPVGEHLSHLHYYLRETSTGCVG